MFFGPLAVLAALSLAGAPTRTAEPNADGTNPAAASDAKGNDTLAAHLQTARILVQENPERGLPIALALLTQLQEHPRELAQDASLQQARVQTILEIARAQLQRGDRSSATHLVDEALFIDSEAGGAAGGLGPTLSALVGERRQVRETSGRFVVLVRCNTTCEIYVNEVRIESGQAQTERVELPLGFFRLTVLDPTGRLPALRKELVGTNGESDLQLEYGAPPPVAQTSEASASSTPVARTMDTPPDRAATTRWLPRWAPLTALGVGVAGTIAGAILLNLDGSCAKAGAQCTKTYETRGSGIGGVAIGGSISLAGLVVLIRDEVVVSRSRRRGAGGN